jgi:ketosteroid isomerase-like protein
MTATADDTLRRLEAAAAAGDAAGVVACLAPDVVIRSPITARIRFEGLDQAAELFPRVFAVVSEVTFYETVGSGSTRAVFWRGRVRGRLLEEANLLRMDDEGRITEMTVFLRPLAGLLTFAADLAPSLAARRGRLRRTAVRVLLGTVAGLFRSGERTVVALTGAGVASADDPPPAGPTA